MSLTSRYDETAAINERNAMQSVREMLAEVTGSPEFGTDIDGDMELGASGIDSGDLVRLVLLIERQTGVAVSVEDVAQLTTVNDYEAFVAAHAASSASSAHAASSASPAGAASSASSAHSGAAAAGEA